MKELVSIIVTTFNSLNFISKTLDRLCSQTYKHTEIILVDDGSTDNTFDVIRDLIVRYDNVYCYRKDNGGVASSRNFGIGKAKGSYIAFCDHDDLWDPKKLENQMKLFEEGEDIGLVYCLARSLDKQGQLLSARKPKVAFEGNVFEKLLLTNFIPFSSVVVKRLCFDQVGPFCEDRSMHGSDDRNLWIRIAHRFNMRCYHEVLVDVILHGENYSLQEDKMLAAGLRCLDDIWSRFPLLKEANKVLYKRSYGNLYFHSGQDLFCGDEFGSARRCMQMVSRFEPWRLSPYVYVIFSLMPTVIVRSVRMLRRVILWKNGSLPR